MKAKHMGKVAQASSELEEAKKALMAFDAQPTKSKKQQKQEKQAFPSLLDEEEKQ